MWWNINKTLSYNALFNFIIGNRGGGKTFGATDWSIRDFTKNDGEFIYVRRTETELEKCVPTFFQAIQKENKFPNTKFDVKGNFIINDKVAGYPIALSKSRQYKSVSFPNVTKIIFDEFQTEGHYLKNEVEIALDLYESVDRGHDRVRFFFLSNAITQTNPYFTYFHLTVPYCGTINCKNDVLVEFVSDSDFIEHKKNTRFGKIIKDTPYGEYNIENKFRYDTNNFVSKKSETAKYLFTFVYKAGNYGVWIDYKKGLMFVNEQVDPYCKIILCLTLDDHTPNTMLLKSKSKDPYLSMLIEQYGLGNVRFGNINVKNNVMDLISQTY